MQWKTAETTVKSGGCDIYSFTFSQKNLIKTCDVTRSSLEKHKTQMNSDCPPHPAPSIDVY